MFITNRESAGLARAALRKYHTFTKQLAAYADSRGYVMLDQITAADVDLFWAQWKLGPRTKGKRLSERYFEGQGFIDAIPAIQLV